MLENNLLLFVCVAFILLYIHTKTSGISKYVDKTLELFSAKEKEIEKDILTIKYSVGNLHVVVDNEIKRTSSLPGNYMIQNELWQKILEELKSHEKSTENKEEDKNKYDPRNTGLYL